MSVINFDVIDKIVRRRDGFNPVRGEKNYTKLHFDFERGYGWDNCEFLTCSFFVSADQMTKSVPARFDSETGYAEFTIPGEYQTFSGRLFIAVQGTYEENGETVTVSSNIACVDVSKGLLVEEGAEQGLYESLMVLLNTFKDNVDDELDELENNKEDKINKVQSIGSQSQTGDNDKYPSVTAARDYVNVKTEEVLPGYVENALENHPEWTTTVQDRSLTEEKLVVGALGYVTPEMYGAAGDGTTDDSQKILNAIGSGKPVVGYKNYNIGNGLCITRNGVSLSLFGKVTGTNGIKIKDCKLVNIYCRELEIINTAEEAYGICLRSDKGKEGNGGVTHCNIRVDKLSIYYKGLVDGTLKNIRSGVGVYFYATRYGYVNENVVTQTDIGAKVAIKFENNSLREMNSNLFYNIDIERSKPDGKTNVNGKGIILKTVNVDISDVDQSDIPESREGEEPPQEFPAKPIKINRFFKIRTHEYDDSVFAFIGNISSNYFDCSARAAFFDEYAKTEDTEIVSGKTYYSKSGSTYTAVAMPDTASLSTYYELIQADTTAANSNIFSGEFLTSSGWRLFTGFKVFYRDDSNGGFNDNKKGIAFAPIDRIKENSKEVDLDITIDPTASYANSYNHYTTFIANSSSATTITLSRGYIYGGIDHLRVIAVPDKMTPKIEDYKHDSIYSGGDTPTVRRIIDIYFEKAGPRIEAYDIYSKSEVEQMINSAIGGVENGSY